MGLLDELDARRQSTAQTKENSARFAQAYSIFRTVGLGTHHFEERFSFGLTFIEKPVASYACSLDVDELAELLDEEDSGDVALPLCSGFVVDWDQDERGYYVGCWVAVRVAFPDTGIDITIQPEIEHHFTVSAIAMKDIPPDKSDAVS